jgi:hypothetical protein
MTQKERLIYSISFTILYALYVLLKSFIISYYAALVHDKDKQVLHGYAYLYKHTRCFLPAQIVLSLSFLFMIVTALILWMRSRRCFPRNSTLDIPLLVNDDLDEEASLIDHRQQKWKKRCENMKKCSGTVQSQRKLAAAMWFCLGKLLVTVSSLLMMISMLELIGNPSANIWLALGLFHCYELVLYALHTTEASWTCNHIYDFGI